MKKKKKMEFSKILLIQESILVWISTIALIVLAFFNTFTDFSGDLTWLATINGAIWIAYGVSQTYYYKKSMAENTEGGINYHLVEIEKENYKGQ